MAIVNVEARLSYPNLFKPTQYKGKGDFKFRLACVIDKDTEGFKRLEAEANNILRELFPDGKIPPTFKRMPFNEAEAKHPNDPQYANCVIANTSNGTRPPIVDGNMQEVLDPSQVYPGKVANIALSVYSYPGKGAKEGITTGLEAVQLVRDGERLDNKPAVGELFKPIDVPGESGGAASGFDPLA